MTNKDSFRLVGMLPREPLPEEPARGWRRYFRGKPVAAMALLAVIGFCCLFAELMMTHDPTYLDLAKDVYKRQVFYGPISGHDKGRVYGHV